MEMHQVRYFLAVAKHLNFSRAAQELGVAQPSLTRAIQKLEKELLGQLFRRERANTHLTELGRMMLPHLKATEAASEEAKSQARRIRAMKSGSLFLGVCSGLQTTSLMELTVATVRQLGGLELSVDVAPAGALEEALMAGELDAAVLAIRGDAHERYHLDIIRDDDIVLAFPPGHRFGSQTAVAVDDLDGEPFVVRGRSLCDEALSSAMNLRNLKLSSKHRSNDPVWVAELVRKGLGCAVFFRSLAEEHGLCYRSLQGVPSPIRIALVTVAGRRRSAVLTVLIDRIVAGRRAPVLALPPSNFRPLPQSRAAS